jgi:ribonucleoside-diphosphate reductase alpha chain
MSVLPDQSRFLKDKFMNVIKRSGELEPLDTVKFDKMAEYICGGIDGVDVGEVKRQMQLQMYDGIKTLDIHQTFTQTLDNMISLETPNYQYAAGRSVLVDIYKEAYGSHIPMEFTKLIDRNIEDGFYDDIYDIYTREEVEYFGKKIDHKLDHNFKYLGVRTFQDKYIVQDRTTDRFVEGPQELYMLVSMLMFSDTKNASDILDFYMDLNTFKISLPSPIMSKLRTPSTGVASCCVIEPEDSKKGFQAAVTILTDMGSLGSGIGLSSANIRSSGAPVDNGRVIHAGKPPILKWFASSINPFKQGSRNNSANNINTMWDFEVEKLLTLKSNKSTEENSIKELTYSFLIPDLLLERAKLDLDWTLFSAEETRDLLNNLHTKELWEQTYYKYEQTEGIRKKKISARQLMERYAVEFFENGRIHPIFINNANVGPFTVSIRTTNLCVEIFLPTKPIKHIDDPDAELPLCVLMNANVGMLELSELPDVCRRMVFAGNRMIDAQVYPNEIIRRTMENGRYLGIGMSDVMHYIVKNGAKPSSDRAKELIEELVEHLQYNLLKASMEIAKEKGEAKWFREKSAYAKGYLPNYGKWKYISKEKWLQLGKDIVEFGLYNLSLSAIPPAGTSADISGSTNGLTIPKDAYYTKATLYGSIPTVVPDYELYKNNYEFGSDVCNERYLEVLSPLTNYIDQGMSINIDWYETDIEQDGEDKDKFKISKMMRVLYKAHKLGFNSLYYSTFNAKKNSDDNEPEKDQCEGGACAI